MGPILKYLNMNAAGDCSSNGSFQQSWGTPRPPIKRLRLDREREAGSANDVRDNWHVLLHSVRARILHEPVETAYHVTEEYRIATRQLEKKSRVSDNN